MKRKIGSDERLPFWAGETECASQVDATLLLPGTGHNRGRANGLRRSHVRRRSADSPWH